MNHKPAFETWSARPGCVHLFPENSNFARYVWGSIGQCAIYEHGRKVIAWQFLIKTAEVVQIIRQYVDQNGGVSQGLQCSFLPIGSKQLTGAIFSSLPQDERTSPGTCKETFPPHARKSHLAGYLDLEAQQSSR